MNLFRQVVLPIHPSSLLGASSNSTRPVWIAGENITHET